MVTCSYALFLRDDLKIAHQNDKREVMIQNYFNDNSDNSTFVIGTVRHNR